MTDKEALVKRKLGLRYTRVAQDMIAIYDRLMTLSNDFKDQLLFEEVSCDQDIGPMVHWGRYTQAILIDLLENFQEANTKLAKNLDSKNPLYAYDPDIGIDAW